MQIVCFLPSKNYERRRAGFDVSLRFIPNKQQARTTNAAQCDTLVGHSHRVRTLKGETFFFVMPCGDNPRGGGGGNIG